MQHKTEHKDDPVVIARQNWERFNTAERAGHRDYVRLAKKCNEFYEGEQWDAADKAKLEKEGRPALTLNMVLSTVNAIIGEQMERKLDVTYRPRGHGNEDTAFRLNKITRFILNTNKYDDVEEEVFSDGVITGRGFFDIRMCFERNMQGDIAITGEDPVDIVIDPEAKSMDPKKWNEVFISRWMTPDQIEERWGFKKAEEVRNKVAGGQCYKDENFDFYEQTFGKDQGSYTPDEESRRIRRVRIVERQFFRMCEQIFLIDMETGDMRPAPSKYSEEELQMIALQNNWGMTKRKVRRVRMTVSADDVLLDDDWSIYRSFTIVPFFPYFRRGRPFGVVSNLLNPQELLNKTSSQELHIVNTTANSGWTIEENSLVDMDADDLAERGAETGLVLTYKRGAQPPEKIQPNQIPTGIDRISQKAAQTIRDVSAVSTAMLGLNRADQSGKAAELQLGRGQTQVSVVLKNLKRARRAVSEKILELVQDFYTETRFFAVVEEGPDGTSQETEHFINGVASDGSIIGDVTRGEYETEVGHAPAGGTEMEVQFSEAIRLREMGVAIPDHVVVQYSNLHQKGPLVEMLKQMQGFAPPTPEQQEMMAFQQQAEIDRVSKELQKMDAEIFAMQARAEVDMAKAQSQDGYNMAAMELEKLQHQREMKAMELSARIGLAARSHQSQQLLNEQRLTTQRHWKR